MKTARRPFLAVLTVTLRLPVVTSLKDKRMFLRSLKDGVRANFDVTVAELDGMDDRFRAVVCVAGLATARARADELLSHLGSFVERRFGDLDLEFQGEIVEL